VEFWQYPARNWRVEGDIKNRLRTVVQEWNPDAIFLPFIADDHEDHRRTSELFYRTFMDNPPQGEVWAYQVYSTVLPNVIVDITDVMDEKLRLVRMHQSQMQHRDWAHYLRGLNALNSRFLKTNEPRYAEMFFVVSMHEYLSLCLEYFEFIEDT
jgi:LmbE family N-acetylglucosaminyl deacetylase